MVGKTLAMPRPVTSSFDRSACAGYRFPDLAQALETAIELEIPDAFHNTEQYANNRVG